MNAQASHLVGPLLRYAHEYALQLSRYGLDAEPKARSASDRLRASFT